MIIYVAKKKNEIVYIGQTKQSLAQRVGKHFSEARKGRGSVLGAGIRKHGQEAFTFEIFANVGNQQECCKLEKELIAQMKPRYNMQEGGKKSFKPWNKGKKMSAEICKKISEAAKNRKRTKRGSYSNEHKAKIGKTSLNRFAKPFLCVNNNTVYFNATEAGKDLGLRWESIACVLNPKHKMKSYKGYSFIPLAQDKFSLIDLDTQKWATGRKAISHRERLNERTGETRMRQSGLSV